MDTKPYQPELPPNNDERDSIHVDAAKSVRESHTINFRGDELSFLRDVAAQMESAGQKSSIHDAARGLARACHRLGLARVAAALVLSDDRYTDSLRAGRIVHQQIRALGVTDAEIAAPIPAPRDILGEIRTAIIDAARKRHPDAIVGNVMTIGKSAGFEGIAPKVIGHVLSVMSRDEKCELVVKNHSPSSVPKFGSYATWVITVRQSRRSKGKRSGK